MPVCDYFSQDYSAARELFKSAAALANADCCSYELPGHRGPKGEVLAIDTARLGCPDAECALVILSGTHGVEGFCGAGCQVGFLTDRMYQAAPPTTCILLVHALNPFGFAWCRRVNENGIDLNRNFIDFSQPLPPCEAYEALHPHLMPAQWHGEARLSADLALQAFAGRHGSRALQAAISGGQYTRPTGLFYGGAQPSWSARILKEVLQRLLPPQVRRLAVLDLHTGLGPVAYGEPILTSISAADHARAQHWYGPEVKDITADEAVAAQLLGSVSEGVHWARPNAELTFLALEFGTCPMWDVLTALRADHWLHASDSIDESVRTQTQRQMRETFYIDTPAWQAAVYGRTADFVYRTFRGLATVDVESPRRNAAS